MFLLKLSAVFLSNDTIAEFAFCPPNCDMLVRVPETGTGVALNWASVKGPDTGTADALN